MKRDHKLLVRDAQAVGYEQVGVNCKGRFEHPDRPMFLLSPGADESAVRRLRVLAGLVEDGPKRNAAAVRGRQAKERERCRREHDAHQRRLEELRADKDRLLAGHGAALSDRQVLRIEREIERAERDVARFARLMTEVPSTAAHAGSARSARHTAGSRSA